MAIKYNTVTGDSVMNKKAREKRDLVLKPILKGLKCPYCGGDSEFTFQQHQGYAHSSSVDWVFHACCIDFEKLVYDKLGINR